VRRDDALRSECNTWFSNNVKASPSSSSAVGWYVILGTVLVAGGGFGSVSLAILPRSLRARRDARLKELRHQSANGVATRAEIEAKKQLVVEQSTWPKSDDVFRKLVVLAVTFVAFHGA